MYDIKLDNLQASGGLTPITSVALCSSV